MFSLFHRQHIKRWDPLGEDGAAAIEFGLVTALILAPGFVTAVDLGFALSERMALDHALRAGAQVVMKSPATTASAIESIIKDVLDRNNLASGASITINGGTNNPTCSCPTAPDTTVACSTVCTDPNVPAELLVSTPSAYLPFKYYEINVTRQYAPYFAGTYLILGNPVILNSRVEVRVQ